MTDIFFSYSSADRERVRPIRNALAEQGFEVFWDQEVPSGMDWDRWIRQHLTKSKCVMAFWSATSVSSDNVRHEATVAKQQGKLISVLLESLTAEQFPMGLYVQQATNLSDWRGDYSHDEWRKFRREFETKLTPLWVRRQIDEIEAELVGERTRREGAERRDRTMQAQIAKEVEAQQALKRERDDAIGEVAKLKATVEDLTQARAEAAALEAQVQQDLKLGRDKALDELAELRATVEELTQARSDGEARQAAAQRRDAALRAQIAKEVEAQQALKRERDEALDEVAALKTTVEELTQARADAEARATELSQRLRKIRQSKAQEIARSIGAAFSPFVIAAAVATVGFWTYQLIWSAPQPLSPTSEQAPAQQSTPNTKEAASVQQPVSTGASEPALQSIPTTTKCISRNSI
jgi:TIR domain